MKNKHKFYLFLIILLAIFFRFYQIGSLPGGLFPDEAANGLDINLMQQGHLQPFYERGNGREALFFYMIWLSVELFGKTPFAHHIVSALVGVFSVLLCFLVTRRLFLTSERHEVDQTRFLGSIFSKNLVESAAEVHKDILVEDRSTTKLDKATIIALLASFLMAVSSWHTVLSRTAFRANLIPLFATLTFYLFLCAYQASGKANRIFLAFLSGASFALGFYTYIAYRIMVPILAILILWPIFAELKRRGFFAGLADISKKYWASAFMFLLAFVIFIYPLANYFYTHPGSFIGRSGQVSIFNPELYTIDGVQYHGKPPMSVVAIAMGEVVKKSVLGYFTQGDLNWRHNISGEPFLSFLVSPFFGVSLIVVTLLAAWYLIAPSKRSYWWKYALLAGWFWGMLIPVVTTAEGIPHGLRSIGTIPAVFIISAIGMYKFGQLVMGVHNRLHRQYNEEYLKRAKFPEDVFPPLRMRVVEGAFKVLVASFCLTLIVQTYSAYFVYAANSPENYYSFRSDLTEVGKYLKERCNRDHTYLVLDKFSVQTTDYTTSDAHGNFGDPCSVPYKQVDPEDSWRLTGLKPGDEVVFTQSSMFDISKFKQHHRDARLVLEYRNKFGQAIMAVYVVD